MRSDTSSFVDRLCDEAKEKKPSSRVSTLILRRGRNSPRKYARFSTETLWPDGKDLGRDDKPSKTLKR